MRWLPTLLVTTALLGAPFAATAQTPSPNAPLDTALAARLDRAEQMRRMPTLLRDSLPSPRWVGDDDQLVYWDEAGPFAGSWVLVDAPTGRAAPILSAADLRDQLAALTGEPVPALSQMQFIASPDGQAILFRFRDKPFRLELAGGRIRPVEGFDALVAGATPAAGGAWVAGVRGGALAVRDASGQVRVERPVAPDQAWSLPDKAWSPDGRRLAVLRSDQRGVHRIPIVTYDGGLEQVAMVPYPKTGTPLPITELHLVDPANGQVVQAAPAPDEGYDWFVGWRPNGDALALHLSRDGKRLDLSAIDASGARRLLLSEARPETNIGDLDFIVADWAAQVTPLPDGGFLWLSERTGWKHVYRYDRDGALVGPVTRGDFPVRRVDAVVGDQLLVSASPDPDRPYDQTLHRVPLAGGALEPVGGGERALHRAITSPSGRYAVDSWSAPEQPRIRELVALDGGRPLRLTASDDTAVRALGWRAAERVEVLAADGVTRLHGAIYTPSDFEPSKRYPVVAYIYGGPFVTVLTGGYVSSMELAAASLAEAGFVVVAIDVRGSALRDKAFQDATYGRIGQTEIPDYVAGLGQISATRPWMDMQRVGIHGYSWGGYYALRGMLTAPDLFKAGYAGAPGALEEDASVNEPNMGLLADNPDAYAAASNMALAGNLQGQLRIAHGTSDVSASVSTTLRMSEALIAAGKQFELLLIPGMDHNPEGQNGAYFNRDVALFFLRTLGEPR